MNVCIVVCHIPESGALSKLNTFFVNFFFMVAKFIIFLVRFELWLRKTDNTDDDWEIFS